MTLDAEPSQRVVPGFPGGAVVENPPANAGDMGSSPGPGRSHIKKKKKKKKKSCSLSRNFLT